MFNKPSLDRNQLLSLLFVVEDVVQQAILKLQLKEIEANRNVRNFRNWLRDRHLQQYREQSQGRGRSRQQPTEASEAQCAAFDSRLSPNAKATPSVQEALEGALRAVDASGFSDDTKAALKKALVQNVLGFHLASDVAFNPAANTDAPR